MQMFRWVYLKSPSDGAIIVGKQTLQIDSEGFVTTPLDDATEQRLKTLPALFKYVPMNNDALWARRLGESQTRIDAAKADLLRLERELVQRSDFLRTCEAQHAELVAERERYQAALDGASAPESAAVSAPKVEPVVTVTAAPPTSSGFGQKRKG